MSGLFDDGYKWDTWLSDDSLGKHLTSTVNFIQMLSGDTIH